ncbi:hypothetical protein [Sinomicrobium weinanense]|uniref:Uncharacterized protein n=1 Tax=Sinomicrobium weinanense TaxID=2842200 RepID=A0A926JV82_9FLAO|nr:hypothetical protein [Sinomicrobium weinanense]MBC9798193.1 hypothetical protein [Sinomicrobium weinanense]MBU3125481.1 hypothetical protein [Sinomicrobium weinanense]
MKQIIVLLLFFWFLGCNSQKTIELGYQNDDLLEELGIGLIQVINSNEEINFYRDENFMDMEKITNPIPLLNKADYGILFFVCTEKISGGYKIMTSKKKYSYIKDSNNFEFYNWKGFLKNQVISFESKDITQNPPRDSINGNIIDITVWQDDDEVEVIQIKENWVQIKNNTRGIVYWLKWKNKNQLLVYLNLLI